MSYHYSRPRPKSPPPPQRLPKGFKPPVQEVVEEVLSEDLALSHMVPLSVIQEGLEDVKIPEEDLHALAEVLATAESVVVVPGPEVVSEPPAEVVEPVKEEEDEEPIVWKSTMNKAELVAVAAKLGLTLSEDDQTKAQMLEALKNHTA